MKTLSRTSLVTTLTVAAISLTACSGESVAGPESTIDVSATETPSQAEPIPSSSTPVEQSSTPSETNRGNGYSYADLTKMSAEQMVKLPLSERIVFARGMYGFLNDSRSGQFGDSFGMGEDKSDIYQFNPNTVASPDNTPEEIIKQIIYGKQAVLMMQEDMSVGSELSTDTAKKLISTQYAEESFIEDEANDSVVDTEMYEKAVANLKGIESASTPFPQEITSTNDKETFVEEVTDDNGKVRHVAHLSYSLTFTEDAGYLYRLDGGTAVVTFTQEAVYYQPEDESQGMWIITEDESFGVAK